MPRALVSLLCLCACSGEIRLPGALSLGPGAIDQGPAPAEAPATAAVTELRRLTRTELDLTLQQLVGDTTHAALTLMPGEELTPYDNDYAKQQASAVWVEAAEALATQVTADTLASPERTAMVLPCAPANDDDLDCLSRFVRSFGRRALHRPLSADEVTELMSLHALARQRGTFTDSVALVMRRLLIDPELLFRVEAGTPVADGTFQLGPYEVAARLSFLLTGHAPSDALLDAADQGLLSTPDGVRAQAQGLVDSAEGKARVEVFHAMWLGYLSLPYDTAFNAAAVGETSALLRKVVFEDHADYRGLFTATETWVDDTMAAHYGLPQTGQPGAHWVSYGGSGRQGILSHASLLANGVKQTDTSPTLRGKWIRNRLFCQDIPPPPPNVVADVPPPQTGGAVCKRDRYAAHDQVAACASCHLQMDPIGFGLEQFDRTGAFRSVEATQPDCSISGEGKLEGVGTFVGPKGLADLMVQTNTIDACVVKQLFRYGSGRRETADDDALLRELTKAFVDQGRHFDELLVDYAGHPTFAQRKEAP